MRWANNQDPTLRPWHVVELGPCLHRSTPPAQKIISLLQFLINLFFNHYIFLCIFFNAICKCNYFINVIFCINLGHISTFLGLEWSGGWGQVPLHVNDVGCDAWGIAKTAWVHDDSFLSSLLLLLLPCHLHQLCSSSRNSSHSSR